MKKFITEPERNVEIVHETDVLVVGSGPGGLSAALAAARTGVKVTLVERFRLQEAGFRAPGNRTPLINKLSFVSNENQF